MPDFSYDCGSCGGGKLTNATPVEHQVPCTEVPKTPEQSQPARDGDRNISVRERRRHPGQDRVVRGGRPQVRVAVRRRRLPERERVRDPMREQ